MRHVLHCQVQQLEDSRAVSNAESGNYTTRPPHGTFFLMSVNDILTLIDTEIADQKQAHALLAGAAKFTLASIAKPKRKLSLEHRARLSATVKARGKSEVRLCCLLDRVGDGDCALLVPEREHSVGHFAWRSELAIRDLLHSNSLSSI
jgi:hypothetical protein